MNEEKYLKQGNGKYWYTNKGEKVPSKCPICKADMGLYIKGEPVFLCKGENRHYYGTLSTKGADFWEKQRNRF